MKKLMTRVWKHTLVGFLLTVAPCAALAQLPSSQTLEPILVAPAGAVKSPAADPAVLAPVVSAPTTPTTATTPAPAPVVLAPTAPTTATIPAAAAPVASTAPATVTTPTATTTLPTAPAAQKPPGKLSSAVSFLLQPPAGSTPPPVMSSQPPPFQVTPDTPAASNDQNFYSGNRPVQDLSALVAGRFNETKYKWYGFVRVDSIYDFHPMKSTDDFVTSAIPIPQGRGQNFAMNPRYTRFGFDTETPIESLDWTIKTRIEVDFFNGNTSGVFGSFPLRLRFAWADFGPFLMGQAASLFMDYDVFPNVIDYEGPGGMVLMRQPIAAIRVPIGDKMKFAIGIEQPYSDIQWIENGAWIVNPGSGIIGTPGVARNIQDVPDLTANIRYEGDYGHMQVAGVLRKLTFQPATGDSALDRVGYGINLTGTFHPWAFLSDCAKSGDESTPLSRSRFLYQFAVGTGISRYIQDINGLGLDATFDPANGFRTLRAYGWFVAYEQWWANKWASNFTYGQDALDHETDTLPGNTYERANYVSANIIWLPLPRMGVGVEYLYGFRKNRDGGRGENSRIQSGFQYKF